MLSRAPRSPSSSDVPSAVPVLGGSLCATTLRAAAAKLRETLGAAPSLRELAQELGATPATVRMWMSRHGPDNDLTWQNLGVQTGILRPERQALRRIVAALKDPMQKYAGLCVMLKLFENGGLSLRQMQLLVYAVKKGAFSYEELDRELAAVRGVRPKSISGLIHDTARSPRKEAGFAELLNARLHALRRRETVERSRQTTYRGFFRDLAELSRVRIAKNPAWYLLTASRLPPEIDDKLFSLVNDCPPQTAKNPLGLNPTQDLILTTLLSQKHDGTYRSDADLARLLELDRSTVHAALSDRRTGAAGALRKLLQYQAQIDPSLVEPLTHALNQLRQGTGLAPGDYDIINTVLTACPRVYRRDALVPAQKGLVIAAGKLRGEGRTVNLVNLAKKLHFAPSHVNALIWGKGMRPGLMQVLNDRLAALPAGELAGMLDAVLPAPGRRESSPSLLARELIMDPSLPDSERRRLSGVLSAAIYMSSDLPSILVRENGTPRRLYLHEMQKLAEAYFCGQFPDLAALSRNIGEVLGIRSDVRTSPLLLRKIFVSRVEDRSLQRGAPARFMAGLEGLGITLEQLAGFGQESRYEDVHDLLFPCFKGSDEVFEAAQRLLEEDSLPRSLKLALELGLRTPPEAAEVCRTAVLHLSGSGQNRSRDFFEKLHGKFKRGHNKISDIEFVRGFAAEVSAQAGNGEISPLTKPFLAAARACESAIRELGVFYSRLWREQDNPDRLALIDGLISVAQSRDPATRLSRLRYFAEKVYLNFLERTLPELQPEKLRAAQRYDFYGLIERSQALKQAAKDHDARVSALVRSFFDCYSVESVITSFRRHLISGGPLSPGVPLSTLLEVGHQAVWEAALNYKPEDHPGRGGRPASFNTFAVNYIKWKTSAYAEGLTREAKTVTLSLEDKVGDDKTLHEILPDEGAGPFEAALNLDQLQNLLQMVDTLPPLEAFAIRERFGLTGEGDNDLKPWASIAERAYEAGLSARVYTGEHLAVLAQGAIAKLRRDMCAGSAAEWESYFAHLGERDRPRPLHLQVESGSARITRALSLTGLEACDDAMVFAVVERCRSFEPRCFEVIIAVHNEEMTGKHETYLISICRSKVSDVVKIPRDR